MKRMPFLVLVLVGVTAVVGFPPQTVPTIVHPCGTYTASFPAAKARGCRVALTIRSVEEEIENSVACWNPPLRGTLGSIASLGSLETAYLTLSKLSGSELLCSTDGHCTDVLNGPYASIPGTEIPLAALGLVAYSMVAALAFAPRQPAGEDTNRILLTALTTAMGVFSVFLMAILFGVLKQSCPYCVVSAILSVSLAKICWWGGVLPKQRGKEGVVASCAFGAVSFLAAAMLFFGNERPASAVTYAGELVGSSSSSSIVSTLIADVKGQAPPTITAASSKRALALARDLEKLNTRFFGAFWCGHCFDQKQELGKEAMAKIPYIECSKDGVNSQSKLCKERDVPGYPTWEINDQLYPGQRNMDELEEIVKRALRKKS
jgi:uncharacterized membrane protein